MSARAVVASDRRRAVTRWLDNRFRNPAAIYGLLVFASAIIIAADPDDTVWDVLGSAAGTLVVFFIAHVFAHTLTDHAEHGLALAVRRAIVHAAGMLYASVPAGIAMVIGASTGASVDDASDNALWTTIAVLAVLGYNAYAPRVKNIPARLLGAIATAALGVFIVLLEYVVH